MKTSINKPELSEAVRPHFPPLSIDVQNRLWQHVQQKFIYQTGDWRKLVLNGLTLGWVNPVWQQRMIQDLSANILQVTDATFEIHTADWLSMGDTLQNMAYDWYKRGVLSGWRNENFTVENDQGDYLFSLERAAFRPLGLCSHAVHINGFTHTENGWCFWIGKRSPFKAVDPNKLDNIVGGGIASGETVHQALVREGAEEAGLPAEWLESLSCVSERLSLREVTRGLHREVLHIFDLILPEGVKPENQDGEVSDFCLVDSIELAEWMAQGRLVNDALLATLDAFERYEMLDKNHSLSKWLSKLV